MSTDRAYSGSDNLEIMEEAKNYNRFLLESVAVYLPSEGSVLDFGAGQGQFARPLKDAGHDVVALEPDPPLRARLQAAGLRTAASPDELKDGSFPLIYTLNVLEHIPDDLAALRILHRKLRVEGTLFVYVPALPMLYTTMDSKVGHVRRYTRSSLVASVRSAGFDIVSARYVDSLGVLATLAYKIADRGTGSINRTALRVYDAWLFPLSRALDRVFGSLGGKNLLLVARKPA